MMKNSENLFGSPGHDHAACIDSGLAAAEALCSKRAKKLTDRRRRVLELLLADHRAVGAYELIDRLGEEGPRPAPIAVYRVLDFLVAEGLAHKIASRNAYIACGHPGRVHGAQFFICRDCDAVAEISDPAISAAIRAAAEGASFEIGLPVVEVTGCCLRCAGAKDN